MIPLVSLRKQHTMKFVVERNKKMKIINTINFKICEIGIGLACALVTGFISNSNNFLSDAFIGFLMPLVIILPFQINGKSVEKTHDLESALQKLEKTNEKAFDRGKRTNKEHKRRLCIFTLQMFLQTKYGFI